MTSRPRAFARSMTSGRTPCARIDHGRAVVDVVERVDGLDAEGLQVLDHALVVDDLAEGVRLLARRAGLLGHVDRLADAVAEARALRDSDLGDRPAVRSHIGSSIPRGTAATRSTRTAVQSDAHGNATGWVHAPSQGRRSRPPSEEPAMRAALDRSRRTRPGPRRSGLGRRPGSVQGQPRWNGHDHAARWADRRGRDRRHRHRDVSREVHARGAAHRRPVDPHRGRDVHPDRRERRHHHGRPGRHGPHGGAAQRHRHHRDGDGHRRHRPLRGRDGQHPGRAHVQPGDRRDHRDARSGGSRRRGPEPR